jgi:hypothetical protein
VDILIKFKRWKVLESALGPDIVWDDYQELWFIPRNGSGNQQGTTLGDSYNFFQRWNTGYGEYGSVGVDCWWDDIGGVLSADYTVTITGYDQSCDVPH